MTDGSEFLGMSGMNSRLSAVVVLATIVLSLGCAKENGAAFGGPSGKPKVDFTKMNPFGSSSESVTSTVPPPPAVDPAAPGVFHVRFKTSKGNFVAEINRAWSPKGADRFYSMVQNGYFDDIAIFRAVPNFMFQFGLHGNPAVNKDWAESRIPDDVPVGISNLPGTLCFAKTGQPNSRSVQMFVNLGQNVPLDGQGFTPFGKVIEGMDVVRKINTEYGENPRSEDVQGRLKREGNDYILERFPRIDLIRSVELIQSNG